MKERKLYLIKLEREISLFGILKFIKKFIFLLIFFYFFIILIDNSLAINIGVSPASVNLKKVLRGGYAEKNIFISTDSPEPISVDIKPRGEIVSWINIPNNSIMVSRGKPYLLKIVVKPPNDIPNGEYSGFVRVMTGNLGKDTTSNNAVGIIRSSLDLFMNIEIVDTEVLECRAYNYLVDSVEKGENIIFNLRLANDGNIRIKPRVKIDIWDRDQINILLSKEFSSEEILPTTEKDVNFKIGSNNLDIGQYWADVSVLDCYSSNLLTFDILEQGSLRSDGVILNIISPKQIFLGETVLLKVGFKNIGEKSVSAQFDGKATLNGKIVDLIRSEKFDVPVSKINDFNLYFTPKQIGKYIISGRILYANKKTYELSTTLEVLSKKFEYKTIVIPLVYILLIFLIFVLFYKIRKERKTFIKKLRSLK